MLVLTLLAKILKGLGVLLFQFFFFFKVKDDFKKKKKLIVVAVILKDKKEKHILPLRRECA